MRTARAANIRATIALIIAGIGVINTARFRLNLQAKHDAWHAERDSQKLKIERLQTAS